MATRRYEGVKDLKHSATYKDLLSGDSERVIHAILSISWYDDWRSAQAVCLKYAHHEEYWIRRASITGLGHIARIHGAIDLNAVLVLFGDLTWRGVPAYEFEDMFSDIMVHVARQGRRNI